MQSCIIHYLLLSEYCREAASNVKLLAPPPIEGLQLATHIDDQSLRRRQIAHPFASLCSVLVLKKLGNDLFEEMIEVINYLGKVEGMRVIVEPQEYEALVCFFLF